MVKNHLKRIAMPRTWQINRKGIKFITRPNPGAHKLINGLPLKVLLKEILSFETSKEVRAVLNAGDVLIDGNVKKDQRHIVGLFDVVSFPKIKKSYRVIINKNAKISYVEIDEKESKIKPCKIKDKNIIKGNKIQLNLSGGKNILIDKNDYKTGDTLILSLPDLKITEHIALAKGCTIFLIGGKHAGNTGKVNNIEGRKIHLTSSDGDEIQTLKRYAFVIGKTKPSIKI